MPEVKRVFVTIRSPSPDGLDPGQVSEGYYRIDGSVLVMTDSAGVPITDAQGREWRAAFEPGTERRIAARLTRELRARLGNERDGFCRIIKYRPAGIV